MPDDDPSGFALRWMQAARADLHTAHLILGDADAEWLHAGFHAQQAVEKGFKAAAAFLLGLEPPRTHDLVALRRMLPTTWSVQDGHESLSRLTVWVTLGRYPDVLPDEDLQSPREAVDLADAILDALSVDLRRAGLDI